MAYGQGGLVGGGYTFTFEQPGQAAAIPARVEAEAPALQRQPLTAGDPWAILFANTPLTGTKHGVRHMDAYSVAIGNFVRGMPKPVIGEDAYGARSAMHQHLVRGYEYERNFHNRLAPFTERRRSADSKVQRAISPRAASYFIAQQLHKQFGDEGIALLRQDRELAHDVLAKGINFIAPTLGMDVEQSKRIARGLAAGLVESPDNVYPLMDKRVDHLNQRDEGLLVLAETVLFAGFYVGEEGSRPVWARFMQEAVTARKAREAKVAIEPVVK